MFLPNTILAFCTTKVLVSGKILLKPHYGIVKPLIKGQPYKFKLEFCNGCKKCAENCPCGYIEMH